MIPPAAGPDRLAAAVIAVIAGVWRVDASTITPETPLRSSLRVCDERIVEIAERLEARFPIIIPDGAEMRWNVVADAVEFVRADVADTASGRVLWRRGMVR